MITQDAYSIVSNGVSGPNGLSHLADNHPAEAHQSLGRLLDDRLHGRWRPALACGVALGLLLAVTGYLLAPVRYTSRGSIHVAPAGLPILRQTFDTETLPRYDSRMATQSLLVESPRVIDYALRDPELAAFPIAQDPNAHQVIARSLSASPAHNSELITVSFEAESPALAQTVLHAILRSYKELFGQSGQDFRIGRRQKLRDRETTLQAERNAKWRDLQDFIINSSHGVTDLQPLLQARVIRLEQLDRDLERLDLEAQWRVSNDNSEQSIEPTDEQLELISPELAEKRLAYMSLLAEFDQAKEQYGEDQLIYLNTEKRLRVLEREIARFEQRARDKWNAARMGGPSADPAASVAASRERLMALIEKSTEQLRELTEEQVELDERKKDLDDTEKELAEISSMLALLEIEREAVFSGSITIPLEASRPTTPSMDRRVPLAGLGFCSGVGMSLAFFFLLGTIDRRTFGAGQLRRQSAKYRLLGLLPDLSKRRFSPNQCEIAAQCIHQIRNRIEALRPTSSSFLLALTSPYESDGKTSLALALGWSYAMAGYRVLLVDCDLVGRGLTRQVGLNDHHGLKNVLRNRRLEQEIIARPALHLDVLSAGVDPMVGPENIRHDDFEALCTELRRQYDIIITDTGPFIGSVEMLPVIACADGVVFSMRRGHSRARLEECIEDLETIRIPTLGVVFNCAQRSDCDRYVSESATSNPQVFKSSGGTTSRDEDGDVEHVSNAVLSAVALVSNG